MKITQILPITKKSWTAALRQDFDVSMDINEKALLYRSQTGDRTAAGILYARYYREIYSYIFYRVNDTITAEKLSAEVFVRMIKQMPRHSQNGNTFISWLYTIARDLVQDFQPQDIGESQPVSEQFIKNDQPGEDGSFHEQNALAVFRRALRHLPEIYKEVIIHRFVEGRSVQDISELINKRERSVRSLQHRALRSLETALEKENSI